MYVHLACAVAFRLILLYDLCPQHTCCTEFGNLHKVVGGDAHIEFDALCSLVDSHTCVGELRHPLVSPCEGVAEFLCDVCAGVAEKHCVYSEHAEVLYRSDNLYQFFCHGFDVAAEVNSVLEQTYERVEFYRTGKLVCFAVGCEVFNKSLGCCNRAFRA